MDSTTAIITIIIIIIIIYFIDFSDICCADNTKLGYMKIWEYLCLRVDISMMVICYASDIMKYDWRTP